MAKPIAGILDLFNTQGSQLQGQATATTSPTLVASTPQSKLHGTFDGDFGYSTAGFFFDEVNAQWQAYNDDMSNPLPSPSQLDKGTVAPAKYEENFLPNGN
jgi:hypothetical protein